MDLSGSHRSRRTLGNVLEETAREKNRGEALQIPAAVSRSENFGNRVDRSNVFF
jgi:hypothetical protein